MPLDINSLGQPIGFPVSNWKTPAPPSRRPMQGRFCRVEPLEPELHAAALFAAYSLDAEGRMWTYLPYGPFDSLESFRTYLNEICRGNDPLLFAIVDNATNQ